MLNLKAIAAKFAGTPEQQAANEREEANYAAWKAEQNAMEQAHWLRMSSARDAGDEELAQQIAAEFRQKRDELEVKYGYA